MQSGLGLVTFTSTEHIVVADPNPTRLERARQFGATSTINSDSLDSVVKHLKSLSDGRGADVSLDFAGVTSAVETCLASVRQGGCVLLAGSVFPSDKIKVAPEQLVRRMITIRGLHNYLPQDLDHGLRFLAACHQKYPFGELVSRTFELEQTQQAFEYARDHSPVRVAVRPS